MNKLTGSLRLGCISEHREVSASAPQLARRHLELRFTEKLRKFVPKICVVAEIEGDHSRPIKVAYNVRAKSEVCPVCSIF